MQRRRFWGWGYENAGPEPSELAAVAAALGPLLGMQDVQRTPPPSLEELELRPPRVSAPPALQRIITGDAFERAAHSYGKSYRDLVRAFRRDFSNPPDLVAVPENEDDIRALLDFCASSQIAVIPYGGGSSVCGGVEPDVGAAFAGTLSLDLRRLDRVLEIDRTSRAARIQAGVLGPRLEQQLAPAGLSLRHFPQSFEFSSLGGWIATRSGGHFATLYTHIDELVESLRLVTPIGTVETRRLPGSGAGPAPERLFIGSEGVLGVIVEAWMRIFERPQFRASFSARFGDFVGGAEVVRQLAQSGLHPANCRLLDPLEALLNGAGSGDRAVLLVGFESADHPLDAWLTRALELSRAAGGEVAEDAIRLRRDEPGERQGDAGAWRSAFLRAPYLRDELVALGVFVETFETAVTWDRFRVLYEAVLGAAHEAGGGAGHKCVVTCRITHAYADGVAPYFTVLAPARRGAELEQWTDVKTAITGAMLRHGGTTTHHHAIGRDFLPFYQRERSDGFSLALTAAKRALDPTGVLNPGVLLDSGP
jgi:alkyldihydroxyacetonephosphate synthase